MPSSALSPASPPVSAADRAHRYVRERILSGEIAGAAMITEGEIAEAAGVSRTPVREAFLRLQAEGLLALHPKRGALVQPIAPGEADDVFELRELIEAHAARRIAARPAVERTALIADLRPLVPEQSAAVAADDLPAYAILDARMHQGIIDAGGNALIGEIGRTVRDRQVRLTAGTVRRSPARARAFIAEHARLLDHLEAGDAAAYADALARHLAGAREVLA